MKSVKNPGNQLKSIKALWSCILIGALLLAAYLVICSFTELPEDITGLSFLVTYILIAAIAFFNNRQAILGKGAVKHDISSNSAAMTDLITKIKTPVIITDANGVIIWYNDRIMSVLERTSVMYGTSMSEFCSADIKQILEETEKDGKSNEKSSAVSEDIFQQLNSIESEEKDSPEEFIRRANILLGMDSESHGGCEVLINGRNYLARAYGVKVPTSDGLGITDYYMTVFDDITDLTELKKLHHDEYSVIGYIILDNLEELAQYIKISYRSAANEIETFLKQWADGLGALIREYDRDKYIIVLSRKQLEKNIESKFDILDTVRNIRLGDNSMPVTISMGIAATKGTLAEREADASAALDAALQRGGDQVALKTDSGLEFFGGRTKSVQRRTKVKARVIASQLTAMISSAGNLLVMGHQSPDFDSIGACIGISRLARFCRVPVKIIVDTKCDNFKACTEQLEDNIFYDDLFIDGKTAIDLIRSDTLLVIVDANNFLNVEAPEVANNVFNFAIIDHHRRTFAPPKDPLLNYIDPSASSACELVTEILEQALPEESLPKDEANIILSGIMVDTKNFTRTTGPRTYSAALYLRDQGANPEVARTFFNENYTDYLAESIFYNNMSIYKDCLAIAKSDGTDPSVDRVAASKAADRLLTIRGIGAAFTLVMIDGCIHISARSNGTINVQAILELIGGGGHFDSAGAQIKDSTMKEALMKLKEAIDTYLNSISSKGR